MSKKIINESLKSPSLAGNIAVFHKELIATTAKRGVLVILSGLFLLLQYFGVFFPSQSANSANIHSDTIYGGYSSKQSMLLEYDSKKSPFGSAANSLSISRNDLEKTQESTLRQWVPTKSSLVVAWSPSPVYTMPLEDTSEPYNQYFVAVGDNDFHYFGHIVDAKYVIKSDAKIVSGHSDSSGSFAVLQDSGNFLTTNYSADRCYKEPGAQLSYTFCPSSNSFEATTLVTNINRKTDAQFIKNRPGDKLQYSLTLENKGNSTITLKPELYIGDILEYSKLTSVDSARLEKKTETLQWPDTSIAVGEKKMYGFEVQIEDPVPISPKGSTNGASYDCYMTNVFGNASNVKLACPTPKIIEKLLSTPPESSLLLISWLVFVINILLWIRTYILSKEYGHIVKKVRRKNV